MRVVGLTGSIACGKSTVARLLAEEDTSVTVIDLDSLAHDILPSLASRIAARFPEAVRPDGTVDRVRLGERVFSNAADRRWLNGLTHWRIALRLALRLLGCWLRSVPLVVLDAPLLFETGLHRLCFSGIVCVATTPAVQLQRLVARDAISEQAALAKIAAQMSGEEKARHSEFVVDNTGSSEAARAQVRRVAGVLRRRWGLPRPWTVGLLTALLVCWVRRWL
jgi:dephospho-CoA kinase